MTQALIPDKVSAAASAQVNDALALIRASPQSEVTKAVIQLLDGMVIGYSLSLRNLEGERARGAQIAAAQLDKIRAAIADERSTDPFL